VVKVIGPAVVRSPGMCRPVISSQVWCDVFQGRGRTPACRRLERGKHLVGCLPHPPEKMRPRTTSKRPSATSFILAYVRLPLRQGSQGPVGVGSFVISIPVTISLLSISCTVSMCKCPERRCQTFDHAVRAWPGTSSPSAGNLSILAIWPVSGRGLQCP